MMAALTWTAWILSLVAVLAGGLWGGGTLWFFLGGGYPDDFLSRTVIRFAKIVTYAAVVFSFAWPAALFTWLLVVIPL